MVTSDVAGQFCGMADSIRLVKCLVNDSQTYRIVPSLRPNCLLQAGTESGATRFGSGEIAGRWDEGYSRPVTARAIANSPIRRVRRTAAAPTLGSLRHERF